MRITWLYFIVHMYKVLKCKNFNSVGKKKSSEGMYAYVCVVCLSVCLSGVGLCMGVQVPT